MLHPLHVELLDFFLLHVDVGPTSNSVTMLFMGGSMWKVIPFIVSEKGTDNIISTLL